MGGGDVSAPFLSVYGHVAIDQILTVTRFPDLNTSVDVTEKSTHLGGTGANIAVVAAKLGVPTALCAFVGADFPKAFEDLISEAGVITDELRRVDGYDTSQAIVDPAQEVHRIWNADSTARALAHCDALFCNRYEAESVIKYLGVGSVGEIDKPLVVCTSGAKGSDAYIDGEHFHIPAIPAERVVDATGAGDAYRAGYYAGLYHGFDVRESLVIAATVSSFVVEDYGSITSAPDWGSVVERAGKYLRDV